MTFALCEYFLDNPTAKHIVLWIMDSNFIEAIIQFNLIFILCFRRLSLSLSFCLELFPVSVRLHLSVRTLLQRLKSQSNFLSFTFVV